MKIDRQIAIYVVTLCVIITMFQCLNVVAANQRQAAIMSRLDGMEAVQRGTAIPASALGLVGPPIETQWSDVEGRTRKYYETHVYCNNLGSWVERKNISDTFDLVGNVVAKWDDCKATWIPVKAAE